MDLETVNEIAATPVLEKAYDDLVHPSAESIGKTVSLVQGLSPFGFPRGIAGLLIERKASSWSSML